MKKISIKNKLKKQQIKILEISQVIFKISEKSYRKNKKKTSGGWYCKKKLKDEKTKGEWNCQRIPIL